MPEAPDVPQAKEPAHFSAGIEVSVCREQLKRILGSREFASSQRLSEFLAYVSEAAFQGRTELSQYDIATELFHKDANFDPFEDAYVRKLATQTRQRIDRYYSDVGCNDPILVSLPQRGYLPRFELNKPDIHEAPKFVAPDPSEPPQEERESIPRRTPRGLVMGIVLAVAGVSLLTGAYFYRSTVSGADFEILTKPGDVMHAKLDIESDGILLGPPVGTNDEVRVRLTFAPERATQQAGIMIIENPDCYIKLGRHFNSRPQLEFGVENGGVYHKQPPPFVYDPNGQTGAPIWLSIRRRGNHLTGFVSSDGQNWHQVGDELVQTQSMPNARVAIYAFNGRTDAPSIHATFHSLQVGPTFHNLTEDNANNLDNAEWTTRVRCAQEVPVIARTGFLEVPFLNYRDCGWSLMRSAPEGDWEIETQLDFLSVNSSVAGLTLSGDDSSMRLVRWTLNGGSITMEHMGESQTSMQDYPGSPMLWLRLQRRGDRVFGSFSRDGQSFASLPGSVSIDQLGANLRFGIVASRSSWSGEDGVPPASFYGVWQRIRTLSKFY